MYTYTVYIYYISCRLGLPFGRCKNMKQLPNVETHTLLADRSAPKSNSLS